MLTHRLAYWSNYTKIAPVMHRKTCCHYITLFINNMHHACSQYIHTLQLVHFAPCSPLLHLSASVQTVCGWLCLCIYRPVTLQFDMQQLSLDELKHVLFHAFRDHLTMKDIENIIITEEESLNETSGNHPEYEGGKEAVLCNYKIPLIDFIYMPFWCSDLTMTKKR